MRFGRLTLGVKPRIAAVITGGLSSSLLRKAKRDGADLLELRVDTFRRLALEGLKKDVMQARATGLPLLLTVRSATEGGSKGLDDQRRLLLYRELTPLVDAVDVELASTIARDVVGVAKKKGKKVVLSYHDFGSTPDDRRLRSLVGRARRLGADVVKIATTVKDRDDLKRLTALLLKEEGLIVIGMGKRGLVSRVFFPYLGSLLTYATVSAKTAPGQPEVKELRRLFSAL